MGHFSNKKRVPVVFVSFFPYRVGHVTSVLLLALHPGLTPEEDEHQQSALWTRRREGGRGQGRGYGAWGRGFNIHPIQDQASGLKASRCGRSLQLQRPQPRMVLIHDGFVIEADGFVCVVTKKEKAQNSSQINLFSVKIQSNVSSLTQKDPDPFQNDFFSLLILLSPFTLKLSSVFTVFSV